MNPWETIELDDYEKHMGFESVFQLQTLNKIVKAQLEKHSARTVAILGITGGNGLEHVNTAVTKKVYGVDINPQYLEQCKQRYPQLGEAFCPVCADLTLPVCSLPHAELVIANLLVEFIGYDCFKRVVAAVKPENISCVIQLDPDDGFVSSSPYIHSLDGLDSVHRQLNAADLKAALLQAGYGCTFEEEYPLPNGKKLARVDFAAAK